MAYFILILLIIFTIVTTIIYAVCPYKQRYIILLGSSLVFYGIFCGFGTIFLIVTILTSYSAAIIIDKIPEKYNFEGLIKKERKQLKAKIKNKKRIILALYVIINIGILLTLKYFNFFASSSTGILGWLGITVSAPVIKIALPLGISYYTLQSISYVVDVLRGKFPAEKNILKIALFISFFPQMHEGPFGRYDSLISQMTSGEQIKINNLYNGIGRMFWGMFKIFMVANRAAIISDAVFKNHESYGGFTVILGVITYTIQLYGEFSGYIDVATGVAKIFGIGLAKNFEMPFLALNVGDFWRRWHISLGGWFRDYIFYPISTSRVLMNLVKNLPTFFANLLTITIPLFFVWFLTGLWHGASSKYILYGLYYFVLMIIFNLISPFVDKVLIKNNIDSENRLIKGFRITKTLLLVGIGMLMFRAENLFVFRQMIGSIFSKGAVFHLLSVIDHKDLMIFVLSFIVILLSAVMKLKGVNIENKFDALSSYKKYWICFCMFCIVVIFGAYGLGYVPPDPIYGGF
ncbi:MBOAT family O-acyltransferase [Oceanirhabdus seepicola]|uniref:MBOAT family protein n=1 Tax=Oceanirhabdus seepicola TaxID=2828781 RepID=A0A9J6NXM8_9CLOT|nr:MBOAT family O-acyltransferase [Oceanirhabdus seepicola]MCM1988750.1 MBOAT family protein [Oceanirhabdus seepicola]